MQDFKSLETLIVSYNQLGSLNGLKEIYSLKYLDVSHNKLSSFDHIA